MYETLQSSPGSSSSRRSTHHSPPSTSSRSARTDDALALTTARTISFRSYERPRIVREENGSGLRSTCTSRKSREAAVSPQRCDAYRHTSLASSAAVRFDSAPSTKRTSKPRARSEASSSRSGGSSDGAASKDRTQKERGSRSGPIDASFSPRPMLTHAARWLRGGACIAQLKKRPSANAPTASPMLEPPSMNTRPHPPSIRALRSGTGLRAGGGGGERSGGGGGGGVGGLLQRVHHAVHVRDAVGAARAAAGAQVEDAGGHLAE
mmetsp:Transcript_4794/g.15602  ORF Transcript_4794/g.15602 Transcript_4794/m.15602 type:complete len:265 (+) Transcript_4794:319-1113(+)